MSALDAFFAGAGGRIEIAATPEGHDAFVLGGLVARGAVKTLLHICRDDGRMARTVQALQFFHPDVEVVALPAWDCLPYDRVSPNAEITSRRIDALTRLCAPESASHRRIVLTTVNAATQRVPPRKLFEGRVLRLKPGGELPLDRLIGFLLRNGYNRTDTVREPGEFAVRGGIVDLFPSGGRAPVRLDFFGDTIEGMRLFDALTQRTTGAATELTLKPVSEVLLDETAIHRFRSRYREQFGTVADDDPLYEAVSAGHRYIGMEHWLPLFYESLETMFDYLPGAAVTLDHQAEEVRADRLASIADFYAARRQAGAVKGAAVYRAGRAEAALSRRCGMEREPRRPRGRPAFAFRRCRAAPMAARGRASSSPRRAPIRRITFSMPCASGSMRKRARDGACSSPPIAPARPSAWARSSKSMARARRGRSRNGKRSAPCRRGMIGLAVLAIEHGYGFEDTALVTEQDILGDRLSRSPPAARQLRPVRRRGRDPRAGRSRRPCRARHRPL